MTQHTPIYVGVKQPKSIKSSTEVNQAIESLKKRVGELEVRVNSLELELETKKQEAIA